MGRNNTEHELTHIMHKKVYTGQLEEFFSFIFFKQGKAIHPNSSGQFLKFKQKSRHSDFSNLTYSYMHAFSVSSVASDSL